MARIIHDIPVRLSSRVRRITENNRGLMTGAGTNTYLVGEDRPIIIDPGEDRSEHLAAILRELPCATVQAIAPTHAHPDHWPLAPRLGHLLNAPTMGLAAQNGFQPNRLLKDGEVLRGSDWTIEVIHTPGHCSDHVCYYLYEERALFSGDHVMSWSTSVIARPDGDLNSYMASLERLRSLDMTVMYPAHGQPVLRPDARIEELIAHRNLRTVQVLDALAAGPSDIPKLVQRIYSDVDGRLHSIARDSVLAHLEALVQSGRIRRLQDNGDPFRSVYVLSNS